jgi:hypothetical protein
MGQEHELAITNGLRDAHEHVVVLRQVFKE